MVVSSNWLMPAMVGLEVALEHAVKLEALPGRDAQRAVGVLVGEPLEREVLLAGHGAGRDRDPDHEAVRLLEPRRLERAPGVAVVLLIGPVELEQRDVVVAEVGRARTPASPRWCRAGAGRGAWRPRPWIPVVRSSVPSRLSGERWAGGDVQSALGLVGAGPASAARVVARGPSPAPARCSACSPASDSRARAARCRARRARARSPRRGAGPTSASGFTLTSWYVPSHSSRANRRALARPGSASARSSRRPPPRAPDASAPTFRRAQQRSGSRRHSSGPKCSRLRLGRERGAAVLEPEAAGYRATIRSRRAYVSGKRNIVSR